MVPQGRELFDGTTDNAAVKGGGVEAAGGRWQEWCPTFRCMAAKMFRSGYICLAKADQDNSSNCLLCHRIRQKHGV